MNRIVKILLMLLIIAGTAPMTSRQKDKTGVYKIIENDHVIIIRNGERYDVAGKKLK